MGCRRFIGGCLGLMIGLAGFTAEASAQKSRDDSAGRPGVSTLTPIPFEELPPAVRERVRAVVNAPLLAASAPPEVFACQPAFYFWLLEHPDQAVRLWRRLGAHCTEIDNKGGGRFGWHDDQGNTMHWDTVLRQPGRRIWYAEGQVKASALVPSIGVQAVVVLSYTEGQDHTGGPTLKHHLDLYLHTDSRAASLAARIMGVSAPHMAEEYLTQMEMFYAALAWYLDQHPVQARTFFADLNFAAIADPPPSPSDPTLGPLPKPN